MRLLCDISVGNRLAPTLKRKSAKSTLALCKQPNSKGFYVILFTSQNKNGTKYSLKSNVQQIFTRCLNDGKSTIQFIEPPHDVYIKADSVQLKSFLHLLKRAMEGDLSDKELAAYSGTAVTPISAKHAPQTKMLIMRRSDYPVRGFPKTLEKLFINDIQRTSFDRGILSLKQLRVLDLSENLIETIPEELNRLPCLEELNVCENRLGNCPPDKWGWMGGRLSQSLKVLNLSKNGLKYLPCQVLKLYNLTHFHVDYNQLRSFPAGIGRLRELRVLTASHNLIATLPESVKMLRLMRLDLSSNCFHWRLQNKPPVVLPKSLPLCSLKELAARKVLLCRIPYTPLDLPLTLIHYLENALYCICGKACFDVFIKHTQQFLLEMIADHLTVSGDASVHIPMDCYYCSLKCFHSANCIRMRSPVI